MLRNERPSTELIGPTGTPFPPYPAGGQHFRAAVMRHERITEFELRAPQPIWPAAVITFGISLTVSWMILLGYGLIRLIELAI